MDKPPELPEGFWDTDRYREVFATRQMGRVMEAYRTDPRHRDDFGPGGISQAMLGSWLLFNQAQVSRIERGERPVRTFDGLVQLAQTLGMPQELLWFDLPGNKRHQAIPRDATPSGPGAGSAESHAGSAHTHGNSLAEIGDLGISSMSRHGIDRSLARADLADRVSVTVGGSDIQMLIDAHRHFEQMYRHSGGLPARVRLEGFLNEHAAPLLAGSYGDSIGRELRRAVAALVALAGICSYDCEHHGAAQRHFDHALKLARSSDDSQFGGYVFALMVNQALALGDFRQAVDHTEAAMSYAADRMSPALTADLRVMQAKALAQLGEPQMTYLAIEAAESSAARIRRDEEPPETSYVQPGLIAAKIGEALISLGDFSPAYRYAQESLRAVDHPRGRVNRLTSMASLELKGGDVERASSLAIEMVDRAQGMESRRLHSRFRELRIALNNRRTSISAEAVERIDRTLRIFPW